jgi:anti-sigma regulatory factor (Ser/Thr protein kinase)
VDAVENFGSHAGLSSDLTYRLTLSLDEIVSNVIRHGYSDTNDHVVDVQLTVRDGVVTAVIEDDGHAYDPRQSPEPDFSMPVEQRGPGGLGIHLVRQMMDSIDYARRDDRNTLTVTASRREGDE